MGFIRSCERYFGCSISCSFGKAVPTGPEQASGDLEAEYRDGRTLLRVSSSRLEYGSTLIWEFPGEHTFEPVELEHLLQCSRSIDRQYHRKEAEKELYLFMQSLQNSAKRSDEVFVLLDRNNEVRYQNAAARSKQALSRFLRYAADSEDKRLDSCTDCRIDLSGTAPLTLELMHIHSGRELLGKLLFSGRSAIRDTGRTGMPVRPSQDAFSTMIGGSSSMLRTMRIAQKAAANDVTILLRGESGTGKEQFANAIHRISPRRDRPFVAINCAAIPENLLESELFGYEEGSFTGANKGGKVGKIEAADTGTIFLDEIGDMPPHLQAKLLRVLQNREFERVGGTSVKKVDVRFISATHRDLSLLMEDGRFRSDLYYRLNVIPIHIPPLREHREDVPILLDHYLKKYAVQNSCAFSCFSYDALECLTGYHWPGNIRELENIVQYCMTMTESSVIGLEDLPPGITEQEPKLPESQDIGYLLSVYGHDTEAKKKIAEHLGISLATLYRRLGTKGRRV